MIIDQKIATARSKDGKTHSETEGFVRCPDALIAFRLKGSGIGRFGNAEWHAAIHQPLPRKRHPLEIRDGDHFPKTLVIRERGFKLRVIHGAENLHIIKVLPRAVESE